MKHSKKYTLSLLCVLQLLATAALYAQNITVIGTGRLGICLALSLERAGHSVVGVDVFPDYIEQLNNKTFQTNEPYVTELLKESKKFKATTSLEEGLNHSDLCFIALSTTTGTEAYNFAPLNELFKNINDLKVSNKQIIIVSTVYPGYVKQTALPLIKDCINTTISYNPPFIAQGEIVKILTEPDMILIGQANPEIGETLEGIYKQICPNSPYIARMSVESAEITKFALNCFVTMKISYANLIGEIADETPGANKIDILNAVGKDTRVGSKYLRPGYGFGGPCFPRDNRGLGRYARSLGLKPILFESTDIVNRGHAEYMAKKLIEKNLPEYLFHDVSYKPNSPVKILQESQKLEVARLVAENGKKVRIKDSKEVIDELKDTFGALFIYEIE